MPRQLKTYLTTSGFFELAVAAPTMKAALEIWGAGPDLFRRGYAKETNDAAIVRATMAKPGVVLKRAVGAKGMFKERPELPDPSAWAQPEKKPAQSKAPAREPEPPAKPEPAGPKSRGPTAAERKAARLYEAARKKRERETARAAAAERKISERREQAIEKAEAAIRGAGAAHSERVAALQRQRDELEQRARDEERDWQEEKRKLEDSLRKARE
jgi:hypothetical protein